MSQDIPQTPNKATTPTAAKAPALGFFQDDAALTKANEVLSSLDEHKMDFTSLFQTIEEKQQMRNSRAVLFYGSQQNLSRLKSTFLDPNLEDEKMHVPDSDLLQDLISVQHMLSLQISHMQLTGFKKRETSKAIRNRVHQLIKKWISNDLPVLLMQMSRATSLPVTNTNKNVITAAYASGIAGYDFCNNNLMRAIRKAAPSDSNEIADRIFTGDVVDKYEVPSYQEIMQRFSIAEEHRLSRSPHDGNANRYAIDSVQWCISPEVVSNKRPVFADDSSENEVDQSIVQSDDVHEKQGNTTTNGGNDSGIGSKKKRGNKHALKGNGKPLKKRGKRKRKGGKGKPNGRGSKRKYKPAVHSEDDLADTNSEKEDSKSENNSLPGSNISDDDEPPRPIDDSQSELDASLQEQYLPIMPPVMNTTTLSRPKQTSLHRFPITSIILTRPFLEKARLANTVIQVVVGDGELVRHGPLLPTMTIFVPSGSNMESSNNTTCRVPIPGDIVQAKHAKTFLGFPACVDLPVNSKHGKLGVNAMFLPSYLLLPDSQKVISMQQIIFDKCKSSTCPMESLQELLSPFEVYGVGGFIKETRLFFDTPPPHSLVSTNQSPCHSFNRTLVSAATNSGTISIWVPPLQARCLHNPICKDGSFTKDDDPLYELLGVFELAGYSYMPKKLSSSSPCVPCTVSATGKMYSFLFEPVSLSPIVKSNTPNITHSNRFGPEIITYYSSDTKALMSHSPVSDIIHEIQQSTPNTMTACQSIESLCSENFFSQTQTIKLSPPVYRHLHAAEFVSRITNVALRRRISLSLMQMMSTLQVKDDESLLDVFTKSLPSIRSFYEEKHQTLCSVLGDCLFQPELLYTSCTTIFPKCLLTACLANEAANLFIEHQCGGTIRQMTNSAMSGLQQLSNDAIASIRTTDDLYTVRHGGKLIHYHPFGNNDGTRLEEWNNLHDHSRTNQDIANFVDEMKSAVSSVASNPLVQFKYFANHMANSLPDGEEHPEPQDPHCDTSDSFRNPWINDVTGRSDVFTVFAPASQDGAMMCIWPIHCGHTCPLDPTQMRIVYIPYGHLLVINGAVFHAGGLCFGNTKAGSLGPFVSMRNLRLQAFFIPEQCPEPCNVDQTLLIVKKDVQQSFSYIDLQHIKYYVLDGEITGYATVDDVKVFRNEFAN